MKFENVEDWERSIVLELNGEHEYICRTHRVNLRPIGIALFDSETRLGQFDSLARTIFISRNLVRNQPWFHVLGVFRHEMAHQLAEETKPPGADTETAHGERFRVACQKLGVPEQYSKAGIDLADGILDWRSEKRNDESERMLEKVRKLLALAGSSNEHEALLAMDRVREIYAKYNLDQKVKSTRSKFVHLVICHGKKRVESHQRKIVSILCEHFFVEVLTFRQFDAKSGERHHAIEIIGSRENVLMAEYVYYFLLQQAAFLVMKTSEAQKLNRGARSSFRLGLLDGFSEKLKASERRPTDKTGKAVSSRSLSVVGEALDRFQERSGLSDYLSEAFPRISRTKTRMHSIDPAAFAAGQEVGHTITLNKPVNHRAENSGKLIGGR